MSGALSPLPALVMRKALLGLLTATPLTLFTTTAPAQASPWGYYGYSSPYNSYSMITGPGGYSGFGYATGNVGMYSDNYGTTMCVATGYGVMCF